MSQDTNKINLINYIHFKENNNNKIHKKAKRNIPIKPIESINPDRLRPLFKDAWTTKSSKIMEWAIQPPPLLLSLSPNTIEYSICIKNKIYSTGDKNQLSIHLTMRPKNKYFRNKNWYIYYIFLWNFRFNSFGCFFSWLLFEIE